MPHALHVLIHRLIIILDLLYDVTKDHDSIWLIISDIMDELEVCAGCTNIRESILKPLPEMSAIGL